MVDTDNNAGKIENGYSISTDVLKKAVEIGTTANEENTKKNSSKRLWEKYERLWKKETSTMWNLFIIYLNMI